MIKQMFLIVVFISGISYASSENESMGIKEMERCVKHAAFFLQLPDASINQKHKRHKRASIKYREDTGDVVILKNALQKRIYRNNSASDFIKELQSSLRKDKDRYEVGDYIYKKGPGGSFVGKRKV